MAHRSSSVATEGLRRRDFLAYFSGIGLGGTLFPGVLWARSRDLPEITPETVASAAEIAGLDFTESESEMMLRGLENNLRSYRALREVPIPNDVAPAVRFDPTLAGRAAPSGVD
ncbi:MAG: amidase, partial [Gemmatimonadetes bacterium]|nr:amidase [Gemmatimonadota bacterium]